MRDDGLTFVVESVQGEEIRDGQEYEGVRLSFEARLGAARIPIQVDIGFGDAVVPQAVLLDYPTLLDFPGPRILSYPRETVVAEKFETMVVLGMANSRMKDFFDIWFLAKQFSFDGTRLSQAIRATFDRRRTPVPSETPLSLTAEFHDDPDKQVQWRAFLKKTGLEMKQPSFSEVVIFLRSFLVPPMTGISLRRLFDLVWPPAGPWQAPRAKR